MLYCIVCARSLIRSGWANHTLSTIINISQTTAAAHSTSTSNHRHDHRQSAKDRVLCANGLLATRGTMSPNLRLGGGVIQIRDVARLNVCVAEFRRHHSSVSRSRMISGTRANTSCRGARFTSGFDWTDPHRLLVSAVATG